ncbi:MAG TPA: signal recognition particle protein [Acidobacteriota bacterium]|nr:signal recognition particle protein [Acidobacteriota bacterium]
MLDHLSERLQKVFKNLRGEGRISEKNIEEALREIRIALLEADVNYAVVKGFIKRVKNLALGQDVLTSLTPGQQVIKIVRDELIALLGGEHSAINFANFPPSVIMLVGLQGSGKTTTCGKLGVLLRKQGRHPLLVPADVYRPAAIEQLHQIADQVSLPCFDSDPKMSPPDICKAAARQAAKTGRDVILVDTAGRLHIDEKLMTELSVIRKRMQPSEILFVADSMTGQDAVRSAEAFNAGLDITGVVLTKLDGDARGGAALSIREITGKPIKFIGIGERFEDLEPMHPDRLVSRILGMGDVLTLIEKAEEAIDVEQAAELERKIRRQEFTLADFRDQIRQLGKMGPLDSIMGMIPGLGKVAKMRQDVDAQKEMRHVEAILNSMTGRELRSYRIINGSRRKRIARGSGTSVQKVNQVLRQFVAARKMMKQLSKAPMGKGRSLRKLADMLK